MVHQGLILVQTREQIKSSSCPTGFMHCRSLHMSLVLTQHKGLLCQEWRAAYQHPPLDILCIHEIREQI